MKLFPRTLLRPVLVIDEVRMRRVDALWMNELPIEMLLTAGNEKMSGKD